MWTAFTSDSTSVTIPDVSHVISVQMQIRKWFLEWRRDVSYKLFLRLQ